MDPRIGITTLHLKNYGVLRMKKIIVIGKSGRNDCIVEALANSKHSKQLYVLSDVDNVGLSRKADVRKCRSDDVEVVARLAAEIKPDFAIIGPEEPLAAGVVNRLAEMGIPCVGPTKELARIEWSKSFARQLLTKHEIEGNPEYKVFYDMTNIESYLRSRDSFVIKPDGLTSGKGVQVFGEHLKTIEQAVSYCQELFAGGQKAVLVEEKLDGEEFSFQSFCDGYHVKHTFPIQDHKRARDGDTGPNTGGMGSYSCEDHSLPFLRAADIEKAREINSLVAEALRKDWGPFKGILYGGFMVTKAGLRLIEYNARFGDPEVMNVLPLLETDFIDLCEAIINGTLDCLPVSFKNKATVCKYIVPEGYPSAPGRDEPIDNIPQSSDRLRVYYAAVDGKPDGSLHLTGSRAMAVVGIGDNLEEAEMLAEDAANRIHGPVFHRSDIGTARLIQRRIDHMNAVRESAIGSMQSQSRERDFRVQEHSFSQG